MKLWNPSIFGFSSNNLREWVKTGDISRKLKLVNTLRINGLVYLYFIKIYEDNWLPSRVASINQSYAFLQFPLLRHSGGYSDWLKFNLSLLSPIILPSPSYFLCCHLWFLPSSLSYFFFGITSLVHANNLELQCFLPGTIHTKTPQALFSF